MLRITIIKGKMKIYKYSTLFGAIDAKILTLNGYKFKVDFFEWNWELLELDSFNRWLQKYI